MGGRKLRFDTKDIKEGIGVCVCVWVIISNIY